MVTAAGQLCGSSCMLGSLVISRQNSSHQLSRRVNRPHRHSSKQAIGLKRSVATTRSRTARWTRTLLRILLSASSSSLAVKSGGRKLVGECGPKDILKCVRTRYGRRNDNIELENPKLVVSGCEPQSQVIPEIIRSITYPAEVSVSSTRHKAQRCR